MCIVDGVVSLFLLVSLVGPGAASVSFPDHIIFAKICKKICSKPVELSLCRWETPKRVLCQTAKTQIKCRIIATNQRVVAAKRQQRGLVAVTIRGSVLFYSSAI